MQDQEICSLPHVALQALPRGQSNDAKIERSDTGTNNDVIESTVNWIGKDSESQPIEYLEECNTHQCGE